MMVRMQIQFTAEQALKLRSEARRRGVSISSIVRDRFDAAPPTMPSRKLAFDSFGKHSSETGDVARNHDDHLADIYDER